MFERIGHQWLAKAFYKISKHASESGRWSKEWNWTKVLALFIDFAKYCGKCKEYHQVQSVYCTKTWQMYSWGARKVKQQKNKLNIRFGLGCCARVCEGVRACARAPDFQNVKNYTTSNSSWFYSAEILPTQKSLEAKMLRARRRAPDFQNCKKRYRCLTIHVIQWRDPSRPKINRGRNNLNFSLDCFLM